MAVSETSAKWKWLNILFLIYLYAVEMNVRRNTINNRKQQMHPAAERACNSEPDHFILHSTIVCIKNAHLQ